jgi:hypothetical protein
VPKFKTLVVELNTRFEIIIRKIRGILFFQLPVIKLHIVNIVNAQ